MPFQFLEFLKNTDQITILVLAIGALAPILSTSLPDLLFSKKYLKKPKASDNFIIKSIDGTKILLKDFEKINLKELEKILKELENLKKSDEYPVSLSYYKNKYPIELSRLIKEIEDAKISDEYTISLNYYKNKDPIELESEIVKVTHPKSKDQAQQNGK